MIPLSIKYNGEEYDPAVIFRCHKKRPIPAHWARFSILVENIQGDAEWAIKNWVDANLNGNYIINQYYSISGNRVVLGFEDTNDAVMYRLMDGETAWRENLTTMF